MKSRRCKVVYSYLPQNEDELKLDVDEIIEVLEEIEEGWWKGVSSKGITGVFPSNFVIEMTVDSPQITKKDVTADKSDSDSVEGSKSSLNRDDSLEKKPKPIAKVGFGDIFAGGIKPKLSPIGDTSLERNKNLPKKPPPPAPASEPEVAPKLPPKPVREQARVLFAYEAQNEDELTIKENEIINIISKDIEDVGWWKGELNGRIALFPDNFVEMLRVPDEANSTSRVKKPERPTEKPPNSSQNSSNTSKSIPSKPISSEINKSITNKPSEEVPKPSVASNSSSSSAPVIPGKKPKVLNSSLFQSKPKSDTTPTSSSIKPDVVPHENGSNKNLDKDTDKANVTNNGNESNFMDSTSKPLTHLTANRAKGPSSRRPPSTIFIPKETGEESKENGDISSGYISITNKVETNGNSHHQTDLTKPSSLSQSPPEKVDKLPPWMMELRKAQEKRKENPDDSSKVGLNSPTKNPNRFSGDFSNKSLLQTSIIGDSERLDDSMTTTSHIFKPVKSTKPNVTSSPVTSSVTSSTGSETLTPPPPTVTSNIQSNKTTNIVISSASSATTSSAMSKVAEESANNSAIDRKEITELEKEVRVLKESTVSRKDFEELAKQVTELKEMVETQKQSYSKVIKDLINDVADERKKLATLQIEIDRLRKLTTTV
ncbi:SH3 domain-containing kinase-binding protein 1-like [Oppia nitens]|uniref:SH3 domain-containing kinase-binding protein 1-like n=1 Tax=Oppia nitens TaxID=1686743 RepID=UPI0023DCC8AC|nr:SH3 domain-containing kinase-binding protein 1-like [Oppia nitens]